MLKRLRANRPWYEWTPVPSLGVEVHARVWEKATDSHAVPIVLVSGLGVSSRYWVPLGRRLAGRFRVMAPDLPGFGRTPKPAGAPWLAGPGAAEQAEQLRSWMDARRVGEAVLVGHSVGCLTVAEFASRWPGRVTKLILIAPPVEVGQRSIVAQLPRLIAGAPFEAPSLHPVLAVDYASTGLARIAQQASRIVDDAIETKLPHVTAPTLVIRGTWDTVVDHDWAAQVAAAAPVGSLVAIDRVGHAPNYSAAAVTAGVIEEFATTDSLLPTRDDESVFETIHDPRHDPLAPPQLLTPTVHAVLDYAVAAAAVALPMRLGWGRRTRRVLAAGAMAIVANNLFTDHPAGVVRKLPMITHANNDVVTGAALLLATAAYLRREPRAARRATVALGLLTIAAALLTAKPTGPARRVPIARPRALAATTSR